MLRRCDCSRVRRCRLANAFERLLRQTGRQADQDLGRDKTVLAGRRHAARVSGACLPAFVFGSEPLTALPAPLMVCIGFGRRKSRSSGSLRRIVPGTLSMTDPVEFGGSLKSPAGGPDGSSGRDSPPGIADPMPPTDGTALQGRPVVRRPPAAQALPATELLRPSSWQGICDDDPGSPPICVSQGTATERRPECGVF